MSFYHALIFSSNSRKCIVRERFGFAGFGVLGFFVFYDIFKKQKKLSKGAIYILSEIREEISFFRNTEYLRGGILTLFS